MFRWFTHRRLATSPSTDPWGMSTPLLRFSDRDAWSLADSLEGTLILGATGSGKTSGSGRLLARSFLDAGYGGLVLTAKRDDRELWERLLAETGRSADGLVFGPTEPLRFNFLADERTRPGLGGGLTENIVAAFSTLSELSERSHGSSDGNDEAFWRRANRQLCRNIIDALVLAGEPVSVPNMQRVVVSAPTSGEQASNPDWAKSSYCLRCLATADARLKSTSQQRDLEVVADYWLLEFPFLSDKTRSVIISTFTSMADVLNRGLLRTLFSEETNVTPQAAFSGKVILVDLPVLEFGEVGVYANVLWKHFFQRAVERRDVVSNPRPVFLWADEAQYFVVSRDMAFQTTARSARVATVYLSQNISNFYASLGGGSKGKSEADSLFANLGTKVFHSQNDPVTNEWASQLVGRRTRMLTNGSRNRDIQETMWTMMGFEHPHATMSTGFSEVFEYDLQPSQFTRLRKGEPLNRGQVDGIVIQNGRVFAASGKTWLKSTFQQD